MLKLNGAHMTIKLVKTTIQARLKSVYNVMDLFELNPKFV